MKYLLLVCLFVMPVYADALGDVLAKGIHGYAASQPSAPLWAEQLFAEYRTVPGLDVAIPLSDLKRWLIENQIKDTSVIREERVSTLANSLNAYTWDRKDMTTPREVLGRLEGQLHAEYPYLVAEPKKVSPVPRVAPGLLRALERGPGKK